MWYTSIIAVQLMKQRGLSAMVRNIVTYTIKEKREALGWSLRKLSDVCGVSKTHLKEIEDNTRQCTVPVIWDIADALGCQPIDLYIRTGGKSESVCPL